MSPAGYTPFIWPALLFALLVRWTLPLVLQKAVTVAVAVAIPVYLRMPEPPPEPTRGDLPYMTPPRLTVLGKVLNVLLTPLDFLRVGWQFQRPISLATLKEKAVAHTKMPPNFEDDSADRWVGRHAGLVAAPALPPSLIPIIPP